MSELKTQANDANVSDFVNSVADEQKKQDSLKLLDMYARATGEPAVMWGPSIIGYGQYHYKSERSRQEGDWMISGFSPRKQNLTLYIPLGTAKYAEDIQALGKCKTSVGCLYINKLADVDSTRLEALISQAHTAAREQYAA